MIDYSIHGWVGDDRCESNNHNWKARPVAAVDAVVMLAPGIFAHILLCPACAATLPTNAGGAR